MTDFHNHEIEYGTDSCKNTNILYSLDSNGHIHLNLIPGILRLSSKKFKTSTNGFIMKEFDSIFDTFPTFMVKTNKTNDNIDKYVIVRIIHLTDTMTNGKKSIMGIIERYIGNVGDVEIESKLCKIMSTCHWSRKIDKLVENYESNSSCVGVGVGVGISANDLTSDRLDMTTKIIGNNFVTVSVDPPGSLDIDDAISIELLSDDECQIGIHIADPSSYVIENSVLDKEVAKRCESIYLSNEHIHMFPSKLSTEIFSLNHNQQSRAFSVIIRTKFQNDKWTITGKEIRKTKICVNRNMTYQQFDDEHKNNNAFNALYEIGRSLYKTILDPDKVDSESYESKKMIEIYMIVANKIVAETMIELCGEKGREKYLSHAIIRAQILSNHQSFMKNSARVSIVNRQYVDMYNQLNRRGGELRIYSQSDQKSNKHMSLNLDTYTHFTSPIRRYSDILVHRLMYNLISGKDQFKLMDPSDLLHQLFLMNHYKKFYKQIYQLEQDIATTHHVIKIIPDPWDRIWYLNGIVINISEINNNTLSCGQKIVVKCTGVYDCDKNVSDYLIGTLHTIKINELMKELMLFDNIDFKACFLSRDMRKIRSYI
jgi:exoribonuclease R